MAPADRTSDTAFQAEKLQRRSERIHIRIPIEVKGTAVDGKLFRERSYTVAINRHGARIVLHREPQPNSRLTIFNLQNNMACPFRVVGMAGKPTNEAAEWGVECLEPDINFWGIFFPLKNEAAPPAEELIDVLLECMQCRFRELAQLTLEDYQTISSRSRLARPCSKCRASTEWTFGFVEGDHAEALPSPGMPSQPAPAWGAERRRFKRVPIKLPVRIRLEEIGETENLSHGGVCFSSTLPLKVGDVVMVTVGYEPGRGFKERPGRIVWHQAIEGSPRSLYGVQLEEQ
jgi:hypothetical protein